MKIITTREFRENQKTYFDLAETERVIIHRGKNRKPVLLTPVDENAETALYFSDPAVLASIKQGIDDVKSGRITRISDLRDIWADIV